MHTVALCVKRGGGEGVGEGVGEGEEEEECAAGVAQDGTGGRSAGV